MANKIKDLTFIRVGKLIAVSLHSRDEAGRWRWLLRCDCGALVVRKSSSITQAANENKQASCGCDHHLRTHGMSSTHRHLHWVWKAMKARCINPTNKDFPNYGGRGIGVCAAWMGFQPFTEWADATGYARGLTIERKDVNAGYEPDNCTWIDNRLQARNRRHTHLFTYEGLTLDIRAWSERSGVPYHTLRSRLIQHQWDVARAITEPVRGAA